MDALVSTGVADSTFLGVGIGVFVVPFLAALILIFFGRKLPRGGDWVAQTAIVACALGALHLFWHVIVQDGRAGWSWSSAEQGLAWDWIHIADFRLTVGILWDNLSIIMATMVTIVASCIFFFSAGYMHGDRDYPRFFAYLSYFCFAMMGLVVVDNLLFLFIFWELVGVGSYLLIGFFYDQEEPPKASLKAFMVNRVGDVLFLLGIILCWMMFGTLNYTEIFDRLRDGQFLDSAEAWMVLHDWTPHGMVTLSGILIFCGAISKSAQVPLHTWLPDAMAGPTPVSALIHAATMVAAGVFMVGRMYPYFTPDALHFIAITGAITALVGATMGIVMWDIKKVLAYSTMSQLGYMMMGLGVGGFVAGLFHLITHAFFKACLFLGSGSVIHAVHSQDMRDMGGLKKKMPLTYWTFLIATLALAGVPCFAGYYSKDQIVAHTMAWWHLDFSVARFMPFVFGAVGAFMTTFYMFRLVFLTFHGRPADQAKYDHAHESPLVMTIPLMVLATFAIFAGGSINPYPTIEELWFNRLVPAPESAAAAGLGLAMPTHDEMEHALHWAHIPALIVSLVAIGLGFLLARRMYLTKASDPDAVRQRWFARVHPVVANKYYFDEVYGRGVIGGLHKLNRACAWFDRNVIDSIVNVSALVTRFVAFVSGLFDKYIIDGLVNFWRWLTRTLSSVLRLIQTGNARDYLTATLIGVLILAFVMAI